MQRKNSEICLFCTYQSVLLQFWSEQSIILAYGSTFVRNPSFYSIPNALLHSELSRWPRRDILHWRGSAK